jgi:two-component system, response regulator, stage 0 sporulation protein F
MSEPISILCVDDEPINLMLLKTHFRKKYTVYTADSGYDGLKQLSEHPEISIVLSDMKMPKMNGLEFINQARQDFPNILYIILTGFDITEEIMNALSQNIIHNYFRKPYDIMLIEAAIREVFPE